MVDVRLRSKRRDLNLDAALAQDTADGAEGAALLPQRRAQRSQEPRNVVGSGVRGEINFEVLARRLVQHGVSNRTPHRVETEARVPKCERERSRKSSDLVEAIVDLFICCHCE